MIPSLGERGTHLTSHLSEILSLLVVALCDAGALLPRLLLHLPGGSGPKELCAEDQGSVSQARTTCLT